INCAEETAVLNQSEPHTHSIIASDDLRRSSAVKQIAEKEAIKGYKPKEISQAIQTMIPSRNIRNNLGISSMSRKDIDNIQRKILTPLQKKFLPNGKSIADDITDSIRFLAGQEYHVQYISSGEDQGFVFAKQHRIEHLNKCGYLTILDSTHKTNHI